VKDFLSLSYLFLFGKDRPSGNRILLLLHNKFTIKLQIDLNKERALQNIIAKIII